jgi:hypothetical protein
MKRKLLGLLMGGAGLLAVSANANSVTFETPSSATTVDANATFVTSADTLTITLVNLLVNPTDVAQAISDLSFGLSSGQTSGSLTSSSGTERTVNSNGTFTDGAVPVDTGWSLAGMSLDVLGTPIGPAHLVIGPPGAGANYSNANGSIAGNQPHNPFLEGDVTFTINVPGLTANDSVNSATFSFGTTAGLNVDGVLVAPVIPGVPDGGATLALLGGAISVIGLIRRKAS